jgi:hypothetical protein
MEKRGKDLMSEHALRRRERIVEWLNRRDTVLIEALLICAAFIIGWRVVDVFDGKPVAPLTSSALLQLSAGWWWFALTGNGVISLFALVHGMVTGNTYRIRGFHAFFGSLVWTALFIAVLTSRGPTSVASGYVLPAVFSWIAFVVLMVKADIKKNAGER